MTQRKIKGNKELLVGAGSTVSEQSAQDGYEDALEGNTDLDKVKLGELNKRIYEDLILSINNSSAVGKVVYGLKRNPKSLPFGEEN